jgi:cell wall-associated NlpC family hydrolase
MRGTPTRLKRLTVAALIVIPTALVSLSSVSSAAPTEEEVAAAKARLGQLQHELEQAIEKYNDAELKLAQIQTKLSAAKDQKAAAEGEAARSRKRLSERAVAAFTGMGSQIDGLLGANSFSEFSDQLEFMGAIAQSDADLAATADAAGQRAEWAAQDYAKAVGEAKQYVNEMRTQRAKIEGMLDEQADLYEKLNLEYQDYLEAQRRAAAAAAAAEDQADQNNGETGGSGGDGGWDGFVPDPNLSGGEIAKQAALSVLGTHYVWGSSDPNVGFDCSGLTAWAWSQAGVSISHSAVGQWTSLPHIPLSQVVVGDIIYYGNFGPHVALYVGGGQIVHARHPGPGGEVQADSMYGYDQPWGAVRPG